MTFLRRILAEPFAQFLLIGAIVAGLYSLLDRAPPASDGNVIDVGPGRVAQLRETFARAWQRPPTSEEMTALIDAFIKEEIFYREGRKMGLDRDDTVFRRRIQQKMEFLMEPGEAEMTPSEADLQAHLEAYAEVYRVPTQIAFKQVFFDTAKHGKAAEQKAIAMLARLNANDETVDVDTVGDPTLLQPALPLTRMERIEVDFGEAFASGLARAQTGRWSGPVSSSYGLHLVYVDERTEARAPQLAEVREIVLRDWRDKKRRAVADERYRQMRATYEVSVTLPDAGATSSVPDMDRGR